jgi:uncharacterized membrane-anchored protein YhcB (DUF1043 family)
MTARWLAAVLIGLLVGTIAVLLGQEPPKLTEMQALKAQLQQAQEQLLQAQYELATCQAQQAASKLTQQRKGLEREFTADGFVFDWTTLTFKPKEEKKP